jgi:superfamily II DNA/RNA helicase
LQQRLKQEVALFNPKFFDMPVFKDLLQFAESTTARILIVANENSEVNDLFDMPFILHFELPIETETFIKRITNPSPQENQEILAITFATDLELNAVKKIEQAIGQKIPVAALPEELVIVKEHKPESEEKQTPKVKNAAPEQGTAFHEKKPSNAKTFNYSSGEKAKMNNKRKH